MSHRRPAWVQSAPRGLHLVVVGAHGQAEREPVPDRVPGEQRIPPRRAADRAVVLKQSLIFCIRLVWGKNENAVGARLLRGLRHLARESLPEANTGDHRHAIFNRESS